MNIYGWDIDNTLVSAHGYYDEGYRYASRKILGPQNEFRMTQKLDGTPDNEFSKLNNPEILETRLRELGIDPASINLDEFFKALSEGALIFASGKGVQAYPGVQTVLESLSQKGKNIAITTGPRDLQLGILKITGLDRFFDLQNSFFLGDSPNKTTALETVMERLSGEAISYSGDSPGDMRDIKKADFGEGKYGLAIGVTTEGLIAAEELSEAGADKIIKEYSAETLREIDLLFETRGEMRPGGPEEKY